MTDEELIASEGSQPKFKVCLAGQDICDNINQMKKMIVLIFICSFVSFVYSNNRLWRIVGIHWKGWR
jgi:hypothetical protein